MPSEPTKAWFHVMWSTFGTWLPGDRRGFRNHGHRIHSDHDYTTPDVPNTHANLQRYARRIMHKPVVYLNKDQARVALRAIRLATTCKHIEVLAIAVAWTHVHLLAKLDEATKDRDIGQLKRVSSLALSEIRGRVWAARGHDERILNREHQGAVFHYIIHHAHTEHAPVWTFRDGC